MRTKSPKPLCLFFFLSVAACSGSGFSGNTGKKAADPLDPNKNGTGSSDGDSSEDDQEASPCDAELGKTKAKLITAKVANGEPENFIEYELSLTDCANKARSFKATTILFDLLARTNLAGNNKSLTYQISAQGETFTGKLREVKGEDLFGNKGPNFYHYRTDENVTFTTEVNSVRLNIQLMGIMAAPLDDQGLGFTSQSVTLPTYLRFGQASAVKTDVIFEQK